MESNRNMQNYAQLLLLAVLAFSQVFMIYENRAQNRELFSLRALHSKVANRSRRSVEDFDKSSQTLKYNGSEKSPFGKLVRKMFFEFIKEIPKKELCSCNPDQIYPGPVGPPGPQGPQGLQGVPGPRGERGFGLHKPSLESYLLNHTANVTDTKVFSCTFFGNPIPEVTWSRNFTSMSIINEINNTSSVIKTSLIINNIQWENRGELMCTANSILGNVNKTGNLIVHVVPKLRVGTKLFIVNIGSLALFPIYSLISNPSASITWKKGFGRLPENRSLVVDGQLRINDVSIADEGFYVIKASNYLGEAETFIQLKTAPLRISEHPSLINYVNEFPFNLSCSAYGRSSDMTGHWKIPGKTDTGLSSNVTGDGVSITVKAEAFKEGTYICEISDGKITVRKAVQVYLSKDGGYSS